MFGCSHCGRRTKCNERSCEAGSGCLNWVRLGRGGGGGNWKIIYETKKPKQGVWYIISANSPSRKAANCEDDSFKLFTIRWTITIKKKSTRQTLESFNVGRFREDALKCEIFVNFIFVRMRISTSNRISLFILCFDTSYSLKKKFQLDLEKSYWSCAPQYPMHTYYIL